MTQPYNAQLVDQLATDFPKRLDSTYAWGQVVSGFDLTPGLIGLWGFGAVDENFRFTDASGQGRVVGQDTAGNRPAPGTYGIAPICTFTRANSHFLYRANEAGLAITTALTIWTWVRFHAPSTGQWTSLLAKWGLSPHYGYILGKRNDDHLGFSISGTGADNITANADPADYNYAEDVWFFVAGRFTPSTEVAAFIGKAGTGRFRWEKTVAGVPAAIHDTPADFWMGATDAAGSENYFDGDLSIAGIAARALTDIEIQNLFSQSRPLFI